MAHDEQAIRNIIARWHEATRAGDVDSILPLMAEDVAFLTPGNPPMNGRKAFEDGLRRLLQSARIESNGEIQEIQVDAALAYALTSLTVRIIPRSGGEVKSRSGQTLSIFRKNSDGAWVLWRDANLLPPPQ